MKAADVQVVCTIRLSVAKPHKNRRHVISGRYHQKLDRTASVSVCQWVVLVVFKDDLWLCDRLYSVPFDGVVHKFIRMCHRTPMLVKLPRKNPAFPAKPGKFVRLIKPNP